MNKMINYGSLGFITVVMLMAVVSLLGIWNILVDDVIEKSLATIGFLALVGAIITLGYRFLHPDESADETEHNTWQPMFKQIRTMALTVMIGATGILGLLGILGIWEVLNDDFFWKSLSSISVIAVSSCIIAAVCFERENRGLITRILHNKHGEFSFARAFVLFVFVVIVLSILS